MEMQELNNTIIEGFRANAGVVGGQFEGVPLLLLTTTGAKSGLSRTIPLAYLVDGDRQVISASFAGAPTNPPWYHNLIANPMVGVEVGAECFEARAEILDEPERTESYEKMAAATPAFAEYRDKTTRTIPAIALRRR